MHGVLYNAADFRSQKVEVFVCIHNTNIFPPPGSDIRQTKSLKRIVTPHMWILSRTHDHNDDIIDTREKD